MFCILLGVPVTSTMCVVFSTTIHHAPVHTVLCSLRPGVGEGVEPRGGGERSEAYPGAAPRPLPRRAPQTEPRGDDERGGGATGFGGGLRARRGRRPVLVRRRRHVTEGRASVDPFCPIRPSG